MAKRPWALVGSFLLAVLGASVFWRLADGPDSDWVVGLITALPLLLAAVAVALLSRSFR